MTSASFGNKDFAMLGRLLIKKNPEVASSLLSEVQQWTMPPMQTDLTLLPQIFSQFCSHYNISPGELVAAKYNRQLIYLKKIFIGVSLSIFHPGAFIRAELLRENQIGIIFGLRDILKIRQGAISSMAHEVISNMKVYDSFRSEVDGITAKLSLYGKDSEQEHQGSEV